MKETNTTRAVARFLSVSVVVVMATALGIASVPHPNRDLMFGVGGNVNKEFPDSTEIAFANASAIQPDGKIIAAGSVILTGADSAFRLVRYNQDSSLDTTFGIQGNITTDFSARADIASALAIQSDGKIVAAGQAGLGPQGYSFALVRYNRDGSFDAGFGIGGKVITDLLGPAETALALAIQSDGGIIAAGVAYAGELPTSGDFALVRYQADGSLDRTFGIDGKVITDWSGVLDMARALAILSDGRIVAAGTAHLSDFRRLPWYGVLARYNTDGSVDTTFGTRGKVTTDALDTGISALAIQSEGKILAAGGSQSTGSSLDFGLVRYNDDGSLDITFGAGGTVTTAFGPWRDRVFALSLQPDGKIVAGGETESREDGGSAFGLARYNQDGSLDTSFGMGGKVRTDLPAGRLAYLRSLGIQRDGTIVAVGMVGLENDWFSVFELARYNPAGLLLGMSQ
jgi:uncharacterized delta-60 repeat protein